MRFQAKATSKGDAGKPIPQTKKTGASGIQSPGKLSAMTAVMPLLKKKSKIANMKVMDKRPTAAKYAEMLKLMTPENGMKPNVR